MLGTAFEHYTANEVKALPLEKDLHHDVRVSITLKYPRLRI